MHEAQPPTQDKSSTPKAVALARALNAAKPVLNFLSRVWAALLAAALQAPSYIRTLRRHGLPLVRDVIERMRQERIGQSAGNLTYTTILALVPLVTVALAIFSTFPMFDKLRVGLEDYFIESLMPPQVASVVTSYLTQFAGKARSLSLMGAAFLLVSALAMFASIERSLNNIWQVATPRIWTRRWLFYAAALVLAPFLISAGFYLVLQFFALAKGLTMGWAMGLSGFFGSASKFVLSWLPIVLATAVWACVYKYMPNATVKWGHAWGGALVSSSLLFLLKSAFVVYLTKYGNFKQMYGAFSVIPVFLIWMYLGWLVTLFGATLTALLPTWERAHEAELAINSPEGLEAL